DAKNFDELDALANDTLDRTERLSNGRALAELVPNALSHIGLYSNGDTPEERLEKIKAWREARPKSRAAATALAVGYNTAGWTERGTAWAALTSDEAMRRFQAELNKANPLFREADAMGGPNAVICARWLDTLLGLSAPRNEMLAVWERGCLDATSLADLHM